MEQIRQVIMENSKIPYVCGICGKKFHNLTSLGKHVQLRHPKFAKFSSKSKKSIETQTNFSNDHQENFLQTKSDNVDGNNLIDIDTNSTQSASTSSKMTIETQRNFSNDHQENLLQRKSGNGNVEIFENLIENSIEIDKNSAESSYIPQKINIKTESNFRKAHQDNLLQTKSGNGNVPRFENVTANNIENDTNSAESSSSPSKISIETQKKF